MTSVYGFPNINTHYFRKVHREADRWGNMDGVVDRQELDNLKQNYQVNTMFRHGHDENQKRQALNLLTEHFNVFDAGGYDRLTQEANKSFYSPQYSNGSISVQEILQSARYDGNGNSVSTKDVTGSSPYNDDDYGSNASTLSAHAVLDEADANGDGKASIDELNNIKKYYNTLQTFLPDPALDNKKQAVDVLINNFNKFANNRGLPPGSFRTEEFRSDDALIEHKEINAIAAIDGKRSDISDIDLGNTNNPNPIRPPRPVPPRFPFGNNPFVLFLLRLMLGFNRFGNY